MKLAGLLIFISDIHSMGLRNTEGLQFTTSWYWDLNDDTRVLRRASSKRPSACPAKSRRLITPPP